jgi:hypothetical protein
MALLRRADERVVRLSPAEVEGSLTFPSHAGRRLREPSDGTLCTRYTDSIQVNVKKKLSPFGEEINNGSHFLEPERKGPGNSRASGNFRDTGAFDSGPLRHVMSYHPGVLHPRFFRSER